MIKKIIWFSCFFLHAWAPINGTNFLKYNKITNTTTTFSFLFKKKNNNTVFKKQMADTLKHSQRYHGNEIIVGCQQFERLKHVLKCYPKRNTMPRWTMILSIHPKKKSNCTLKYCKRSQTPLVHRLLEVRCVLFCIPSIIQCQRNGKYCLRWIHVCVCMHCCLFVSKTIIPYHYSIYAISYRKPKPEPNFMQNTMVEMYSVKHK